MLYSLTSKMLFIYNFLTFKSALIHGLIYKPFLKECGKNFQLQNHCRIYSPGNVEIGEDVGISHHTDLDGHGGLKIGNFAMIGPYSQIITANHSFDSVDIPIKHQGICNKSVLIGNDVWVGTHVVILPGVTIGDGSIIGAGSVVTKSIPPYSIAVGNPTRIIASRSNCKVSDSK